MQATAKVVPKKVLMDRTKFGIHMHATIAILSMRAETRQFTSGQAFLLSFDEGAPRELLNYNIRKWP